MADEQTEYTETHYGLGIVKPFKLGERRKGRRLTNLELSLEGAGIPEMPLTVEKQRDEKTQNNYTP